MAIHDKELYLKTMLGACHQLIVIRIEDARCLSPTYELIQYSDNIHLE